MSARRLHNCNNEPIRLEGPNGVGNRSNRWPVLTTTTAPSINSRLAAADEKARRSQVFKGIEEFYSNFLHLNL
jgi:hypothetical protein